MRSLLLKYNNYLIFFILLIFLIALKIVNPSFIKSISYLSFDLYQKVFPLEKRETDVIIIDIDEKSLGKFGQFPWSRSVFAKIIENVNTTNPKADIIYNTLNESLKENTSYLKANSFDHFTSKKV